MSTNRSKWLLSMILAAVIIALPLAGGNWKVSQAGSQQPAATVPTIPTVQTIDYQTPVYVGRPDLMVTITGSQFIDAANTKVRWTGPDSVIVTLDPFFVSADGTQLKVIIPQNLLNKFGTAKLFVINHPGADETEVSPTYDVIIWIRLHIPLIWRASQ